MTRFILIFSLLLLAIGCRPSQTTVADPSPSAIQPSTGDTDETTTTPPQHARVEAFINNHEFGDLNGCTMTFTPQPKSLEAATLICGHPGAVSKLTCQYLHTDEAGDWYRLERRFPYNEPDEQTTIKEVLYEGRELLLFEDEVQRIIMRPASGNPK